VEFKGTRDPEDIVKRFSDVAVDALPQGDRLFEEKARDPQFSEYLKRQSGMQHAAKVLRDVRMARFGVAKDQINELFGGAAGQQLDTRALFLVSPPDLASLAIGVFDAPRDTFKNVTTLPDFINRLTTAGLSSTELRNQFVKFLKIANDYYRGHRKMDTSGNYYSAKVDMTKMKLGSTHEDGYYDVAVGEGVGVAPVSMALAPKQAFQHIQDSLAGVTVSNPIMKGREQFQNLVKDTMAVVDNGLYKEKELLLRYKASFAYKAFDRIRDQLLSTDVAISTVTYTVNPGANDPQAGLFSVIDLPPVNGVLVPPHVIRVSIRGRSISLNEGQFFKYDFECYKDCRSSGI
jgi:hypothetical protein